MKIPKNVGACIDKLYELREQRKKIQRTIDDIEKDEKLLEDHLIEEFDKDELEGARGKRAQLSIERPVVGNFDDFDKFWKWVKKTNRADLLQRRLNNKGLRELWEKNVEVPGVVKFTALKLHLTKR